MPRRDPSRSSLSADRRKVGDVEVLALGGELDMASGAELWTLVEATGPEAGGVVLDLSGLDFLDPAGIRAILEARTAARATGRPVELLCRQDTPAYRTLRLTGMLGKLRVYRDLDVAVSAAGPPAP